MMKPQVVIYLEGVPIAVLAEILFDRISACIYILFTYFIDTEGANR